MQERPSETTPGPGAGDASASRAAGVRGPGRLGPAERVRSRGEFARLQRGGRRVGDAVLRLVVASNGLGWSRLGCAVPRRYGSAVRRNRFRRLVREAFRLEKATLPAGYDVVVSPVRTDGDPTLTAVRASLVALIRQAVERLARPGRGRRGGPPPERRP